MKEMNLAFPSRVESRPDCWSRLKTGWKAFSLWLDPLHLRWDLLQQSCSVSSGAPAGASSSATELWTWPPSIQKGFTSNKNTLGLTRPKEKTHLVCELGPKLKCHICAKGKHAAVFHSFLAKPSAGIVLSTQVSSCRKTPGQKDATNRIFALPDRVR